MLDALDCDRLQALGDDPAAQYARSIIEQFSVEIAHQRAKLQFQSTKIAALSFELARLKQWRFGQSSESLGAPCFTARHHHLHKDSCAFRCRDDADGLLLRSSEGQPFLCLNGTQVQSAGLQALLHEAPALRQAGVERIRLSPCSQGFIEVIEHFEAVYNQGATAEDALVSLRALSLPGSLINGYVHHQPGMLFEPNSL
ncbi:Peptidase U32 (fragment) [Thiomonas sp. X19]